MKCDGTPAKTRFCLSAKRTSPSKSAGTSVQSTTGSRGLRISVSNAGYTMLRGSVKGTAYPFNSPVSPSLPLPCVNVCHHISAGVYEGYMLENSEVSGWGKGEDWKGVVRMAKLCIWKVLLKFFVFKDNVKSYVGKYDMFGIEMITK